MQLIIITFAIFLVTVPSYVFSQNSPWTEVVDIKTRIYDWNEERGDKVGLGEEVVFEITLGSKKKTDWLYISSATLTTDITYKSESTRKTFVLSTRSGQTAENFLIIAPAQEINFYFPVKFPTDKSGRWSINLKADIRGNTREKVGDSEFNKEFQDTGGFVIDDETIGNYQLTAVPVSQIEVDPWWYELVEGHLRGQFRGSQIGMGLVAILQLLLLLGSVGLIFDKLRKSKKRKR